MRTTVRRSLGKEDPSGRFGTVYRGQHSLGGQGTSHMLVQGRVDRRADQFLLSFAELEGIRRRR